MREQKLYRKDRIMRVTIDFLFLLLSKSLDKSLVRILVLLIFSLAATDFALNDNIFVLIPAKKSIR